MVCGAVTLVVSSGVIAFSNQDAWISAIFATVIGMAFIFLYTHLGGLYPDKTFINLLEVVLGKWLGKLTGVIYVMFWIIAAAQAVWYVGDFITTQFIPMTSAFAINILFVSIIGIALLYGLEALARASEIFYYIIIPIFIISMILLIPNVRFDNVLPVYEKGLLSILKGTFPLFSFAIFPVILINMIYPTNVNNIKKAKKAIIKGFLLGMLIDFISILMSIFVLGITIPSNGRFTVFLLTKEINIGNVLSRLEALIVIVWIITIFIITCFIFYNCIYGLSGLFKLKGHKNVVFPVCLIIFVLSDFIYYNVPYQMNWDSLVWLPSMATFGFVLPLILLVITWIKGILKKIAN